MASWRGRVVLAGAAMTLWLAPPAAGAVYGDFNGDGFADLAVGVPFEDVGDIPTAGAVNVLYGSRTGLSAVGDQFWHQDTVGVPDSAEGGDHFGSALAAGDFDADGFADLAIGAPDEDVGDLFDAGTVTILYGSSTGLADDDAQVWHQGSPDIAGDGVEANDLFGFALAAANFGKNSAADLAVGVRGEDGSVATNIGAVNVLYGSAAGLTAAGDQFWHQDVPGVGDAAEAGDDFGFSLAAANFGKNSAADLAVGVVGENVGVTDGGGAVHVLYGSTAGLTATGDQFWHQGVPGVAEGPEIDDAFGFSLAAANFGKSSAADLAVGVVGESVGATVEAGAVNVLYGSTAGLTAAGDQFWHQGVPGVADGPEGFDHFGSSLAAANFGKGSAADLAIGARREGLPIVTGAVNLLYGSAAGLTAAGDQFWHQGVPGVAGDGPEGDDFFGSSLAAANFGKSSAADLAVGVRFEDVGAVFNAGAVNVFYGSDAGLTAAGDQFWHQAVPGVAGDGAEEPDTFGSALAPRR